MQNKDVARLENAIQKSYLGEFVTIISMEFLFHTLLLKTITNKRVPVHFSMRGSEGSLRSFKLRSQLLNLAANYPTNYKVRTLSKL